MATSLTVKELLTRNSAYAEDHQRIPTWEELGAAGAPAPQILIITCADPSLHVTEALVFRTTGADVKSVLPGILALDTLVGLTDILVVKHTDCGGLTIRDANVKKQLVNLAPELKARIDAMEFGEITGSLEDSAEEEVAFLQNSELLRPELKERIYGYVWNLETGSLKSSAPRL